MGKQVAARFFQKKTGFTSDQRLQDVKRKTLWFLMADKIFSQMIVP